MSDPDEYRPGIPRPPKVAATKACAVDVHDEFGDSIVHVNTWWSGAGITVGIQEGSRIKNLDLDWAQWEALRLAVEALQGESE